MMARSSSKPRHPCPNRPPRGIARSKKVHVRRLVIPACKRESRSRKGELDARVRGPRRGRRSSPFGSRKRLCEIERNENAVKPLKINNVSEISDSAIVMISMGYDLRCETFVSLSERFVSFFAGFGLVDARNEMGRGVLARHHSECRRLGSCGRKKLRKRAANHEIIGSRKLVRGLHRGCQLRRRSAEQVGARDGDRDGRFRRANA